MRRLRPARLRRLAGPLVALVACLACLAPGVQAKAKKPKTFIFLHDNGAVNKVHVLSLARGGVLAPAPGSPFPTGGAGANVSDYAQSLAYAPSLKLLFAGGADGITVFRVAKSGALTEVVGSPFGGPSVTSLVSLTRGTSVFVYALAGDEVAGFQAAGDGSLTAVPGGPLAASDSGRLATFGTRVFVTDVSEGEVRTIQVNPNGSLLNLNLTTVGDVTTAFPSPEGFFYCLPEVGDTVLVFRSLPIGTPQAVPGSPFDAGLSASAVALAHSAALTFVAGDDEVNVFTRAPNGALALKSNGNDVAMESIECLAADLAGKVLTIVSGGDLVRTFGIDSATGALTLADELAIPIGDGNSCTGLVIAKL